VALGSSGGGRSRFADGRERSSGGHGDATDVSSPEHGEPGRRPPGARAGSEQRRSSRPEEVTGLRT
jgi:hypothetical protein